MAYSMYLDEVLFPVTPDKITYRVGNKNTTVTLINMGESIIIRPPGLAEISFEVLLPRAEYPFAVYLGGFTQPENYLEKLEALKIGCAPFQWVLTRNRPQGSWIYSGTSRLVTLETYSVTEDARQGQDVTAAITLKEYRAAATRILTKGADGYSLSDERQADSAPSSGVYTVVKGDTLWNIAKQHLGSGGRYMEIYNLNTDKLKSANLIYPGQVLTMPG